MDTPTTQQLGNTRDAQGRFIPGISGNPTGQGGFKENPQNINPGGRPKNEQRFSYWLQFFKDMKFGELEKYRETKPFSEMYTAELAAYNRVMNAITNFEEYKDLADRTEGKAKQLIENTGGFFSTDTLKIEILNDKPLEKEDIENENKQES